MDELEQTLVSSQVVGECANYLKEGGEVTALFFEDKIYAVEHPQFLELMIARTEDSKGKAASPNGDKKAILETGATIMVPPFIEAGDVIKVDTKINEYIQRV